MDSNSEQRRREKGKRRRVGKRREEKGDVEEIERKSLINEP